MEEIVITQNGWHSQYIQYIYEKVKERFSFLPSSSFYHEKNGQENRLVCSVQSPYVKYVKRYAEEWIAEVIAIGYKYVYFEKYVHVPMLKREEKQLLITALVSADFKEDKHIISQQLSTAREGDFYSIDGVFHFRLQSLKKRWKEIAEYVPMDMGKIALDGFMGFLVEDGDGKIFIKDGKVYDENYHLLSRSLLTGKQGMIGEIVLGGAERVYCFGETGAETRKFLKKYYGEKVSFC